MTNYEKYYGSPEAVVESLPDECKCPVHVFGKFHCWECPYEGEESCKPGILRWLQEEAE